METQKPPIRIVIPGKTYRQDSDATHSPMFHQVEGLVIDRRANVANMNWVLEEFCKAFFEVPQLNMRFRPTFFPFTEPSLEVDIQCDRSRPGEVRFGEGSDWMEILGCGMVHPNVLRFAGLDPDEYQGFAWGMGIDRIAMLKYGMPDLRAFFDADVRWLAHYGFRPLDMPTLFGGLSHDSAAHRGCRCGAVRFEASAEPDMSAIAIAAIAGGRPARRSSAFVGFPRDARDFQRRSAEDVRERPGDAQLLRHLRFADRLCRRAASARRSISCSARWTCRPPTSRRCMPMCASNCPICTCPTACRAIWKPAWRGRKPDI